jgi:pimeloyl-ACP methyl ester carboxylesterase
MTPPKYGRYLADHIPHAEFVSVAGAGHMLAMEQPDLVGDTIRDFVHRRLSLS